MTKTTTSTLEAKISSRAFADIEQLSDRDKAYQSGNKRLQPFYKYEVNLDTFDQVVEERSAFPTDRNLLHRELTAQLSGIALTPQQAKNLDLITDTDTYTVITAHQPSLLTGPLYFIYKIASTIHLAKDLSNRYDKKHVVPIFITGGEDHDFDEINHLHLFGNRIAWDTDHGGPVGRLSTATLHEVIAEVGDILGSSNFADEARGIMQQALTASKDYFEFTRSLVQQLFGHYGLLIVSMDDPALKQAFAPIVKKEITHQVSKPLITAVQDQIEQAGFSPQTHVRDINVFYLTDDRRDRIEFDGDQYSVVDTGIRWSEQEVLEEIDKHPERFSPNVNLRPVYQELIFPNLAYIGGGGELAYWLERQSQFKTLGIPYPMLVRRNSVLLLGKSNRRNLDKLELHKDVLWQPTHRIIHQLIDSASEVDLDIDNEVKALESAYQSIADRAAIINPGLGKYVLAEQTKAIKQIEQVGSRLKREVKQREEVRIKQVEKLKEKLFPEGGLQERHDNIWQYFVTYGPALIDYLVEHLDPMKKDFLIVELED